MQYTDGNGFLLVTEQELSALHSKFGAEGAANFLNDYVDEHQLKFPVIRPTLDDAHEDHQQLLNFNAKTLLRSSEFQVGCRYPVEGYPLSNRYIASNRIGTVASNFFHYHARAHCGHERNASPMRVWSTPKSRLGVFKAIFSLKKTHVDSTVLGSCISMRKYWAVQFRPSTYKALIEKYASNGSVLDPCSGWGDRLGGFLASSAQEYVGCDPNLRLHHGYRSQIHEFKQEHQSAKVIYSPFEKYKPESNHFDLVATSPPYFCTEQYSADKDQSYLKYGTVDEWIKKFLIPMVKISYDALKPNGVLAINISDVYVHGAVQSLCKPMNDYITNKLKAKPMPHVGYQISRRANINVPIGGVAAEPIFMYRKR